MDSKVSTIKPYFNPGEILQLGSEGGTYLEQQIILYNILMNSSVDCHIDDRTLKYIEYENYILQFNMNHFLNLGLPNDGLLSYQWDNINWCNVFTCIKFLKESCMFGDGNTITTPPESNIVGRMIESIIEAINGHNINEIAHDVIDLTDADAILVLEIEHAVNAEVENDKANYTNTCIHNVVNEDFKLITDLENEDVYDESPVTESFERIIENNACAVNNDIIKNDNLLQQLLIIEEVDLIENIETFTCSICLMDCEPGEGVVLHECLHSYCRGCLVNLIQHCEDAEVKCPYRSDDNTECVYTVLDREIRSLVSKEDYETHLERSIRFAETTMADSFHCLTADCPGWCVHDPNVQVFQCPQCRQLNCLICVAIHDNESCHEYQDRIERQNDPQAGTSGLQSEKAIGNMIAIGEAIHCPNCRYVVMKDKGSCDWVACVKCKTEICWATKGPRWGPLGKGDNTGGCRCKLGGLMCHPQCGNCH